jgi:hypothetical protein
LSGASSKLVIHRPPFNLASVLLWCGIVTPTADVALIAFFASLHPDYDHLRQLMSELGEQGRPHAGLVNAWFSTASLLFVAFGAGLVKSLPPSSWSLVGASLYMAWAGLGACSCVFPCDPGCRGQTPSGWLHLTLGEAAAACILAVPTLVWVGSRWEPTWRGHGWFALIIQTLVVCFTIASAGAAFEAYVGNQPLREWAGLFQRLTWGVIYAWTVVMAWTLLRFRRESMGDDQGTHS